MSRADPQMKIRLPEELKNRIEEAAKDNKRSMNAEIVGRLEKSFDTSPLFNRKKFKRFTNLVDDVAEEAPFFEKNLMKFFGQIVDKCPNVQIEVTENYIDLELVKEDDYDVNQTMEFIVKEVTEAFNDFSIDHATNKEDVKIESFVNYLSERLLKHGNHSPKKIKPPD